MPQGGVSVGAAQLGAAGLGEPSEGDVGSWGDEHGRLAQQCQGLTAPLRSPTGRRQGVCQALGKGLVAVRRHVQNPHPPPPIALCLPGPPAAGCIDPGLVGAGRVARRRRAAYVGSHVGGHVRVTWECRVGGTIHGSEPDPSCTGCGEGLAQQKWLPSQLGGGAPGQGVGRRPPSWACTRPPGFPSSRGFRLSASARTVPTFTRTPAW